MCSIFDRCEADNRLSVLRVIKVFSTAVVAATVATTSAASVSACIETRAVCVYTYDGHSVGKGGRNATQTDTQTHTDTIARTIRN